MGMIVVWMKFNSKESIMSMLFKKNKRIFNVAGALAFLLAFSLTACDGDDNVSASENDSHEAHCDSLRASVIKPMQPCNDSLEGYFFASRGSNNWILELSPCGASPDIIYYKCENNEWNAVSSTEIPVGAVYVSTADNEDKSEKINLGECDAEKEGLIDSVVHKGTKYEAGYARYYKCEHGSWNETEASAACDTAGVSLGDVCKIHGNCYKYLGDGAWNHIICLDALLPECDTAGISVGAICTKSSCFCTYSFMGCEHICVGKNTYLYMGDGVWKTLAYTGDFGDRSSPVDSSLAQWTKECTAENEGETEKHVYGVDPDVIELYYKCVDGEWTDMSETDYYCTTEKPKIGDTCSAKLGDRTRHYIYLLNDVCISGMCYDSAYQWVESTVDPELGYCPMSSVRPNNRYYGHDYYYENLRYVKKGEEFYTCDGDGWKQVGGLVPHQYTDPRKEGLTDEEYDVLDLPKEASVGDRVGGLLENCFNNKELELGGPDEWRYETYDYCLSQNYYRYREDGSWTLETEEDLESDKHKNPPECTPESEGAEYISLLESREPGKNFKRISVECESETECTCKDELVGYTFGRSEKK